MKQKTRVNMVNVVRKYFGLGARILPTLRAITTVQLWDIPKFRRGYPNGFSEISFGIYHKILGFGLGYPNGNHNILGLRFFNIFRGPNLTESQTAVEIFEI
jgi:hypothetical protein